MTWTSKGQERGEGRGGEFAGEGSAPGRRRGEGTGLTGDPKHLQLPKLPPNHPKAQVQLLPHKAPGPASPWPGPVPSDPQLLGKLLRGRRGSTWGSWPLLSRARCL